MSQPAVKWGKVRRFFERRGYGVRRRGGDVLIVAPPDSGTKRPTVRIGHKYCDKPGRELLPAYLKAIERAFGVTRADILDD